MQLSSCAGMDGISSRASIYYAEPEIAQGQNTWPLSCHPLAWYTMVLLRYATFMACCRHCHTVESSFISVSDFFSATANF